MDLPWRGSAPGRSSPRGSRSRRWRHARHNSRSNDCKPVRWRLAARTSTAAPCGGFVRSPAGACARSVPEHLHYGDPRGSSELRAAIADHLLSARGLRCDPEQIMLTTGTQHGLRIVLSAILKAGDRVWCEDPGYPAARNAIDPLRRPTLSPCRSISPASSLREAVQRHPTHAPPTSRRRISFHWACRCRCRAGSSCSTGRRMPTP